MPHTPGDWFIGEPTNTKPCSDEVIAAGPHMIRSMVGNYNTTVAKVLKAQDAPIVTAAPEMLRVLQSMNHMGGDERGGYCICPVQDGSAPDSRHASICADARAVIAKASHA